MHTFFNSKSDAANPNPILVNARGEFVRQAQNGRSPDVVGVLRVELAFALDAVRYVAGTSVTHSHVVHARQVLSKLRGVISD